MAWLIVSLLDKAVVPGVTKSARLEGLKRLSMHTQSNVVLLQAHGELMADSLDRVGTIGYPFREEH